MTSETPGQGANPGWGQPPAPGGDAPTEPIPPAPWGQQPAAPAQPVAPAPAWGQPPTQQPAAPAAPAWGQPPAQQPAPQQPAPAPAWTQPPQAPAQQPPQAPAQQPPSQPAPQWNQPQAPQQPGWGAPPPQQAPQQPGWNAAPQAPMQQPVYGGQQPGWNGGAPPPPKQGNGCLKACLIVAVIGVVLFVIAMIALYVLGSSFLSGMGINSDGTLKACPIVSNSSLETVLGKDAMASELGGLADATFGRVLDKRVLPDAQDCWIGASNSSTGGLGRIAKYSGLDAGSKFQAAHDAAQSGTYLAIDLNGVGDQAFCTGMSDFIATGVLIRKGSDLVYVSLIADSSTGPGLTTNDSGVVYDPQSCKVAQQVAMLALR